MPKGSRAHRFGGEIVGDRLVQAVWTAEPRTGRVITARTYPGLLGHAGSIDDAGRTLIDGHPWDSADAREAVRVALGSETFELAHYDGQGRRDSTSCRSPSSPTEPCGSLATTGAGCGRT